MHSEVSRRIGAVVSVFGDLDRVRKHANVSKTRTGNLPSLCIFYFDV